MPSWKRQKKAVEEAVEEVVQKKKEETVVRHLKHFPNEEIEAAALAFVNDIRRNLGAPILPTLPKGSRRAPNLCPIGRSLSDLYTTGQRGISQKSIRLGNATYSVPEPLIEFMSRFDEGGLPHLIDKGTAYVPEAWTNPNPVKDEEEGMKTETVWMP